MATCPSSIDLELPAGIGEVVALTGDNGSGKTTLLRTIAGLLPPLSGRVERRPGRIAYLPQNPSSLLHRATRPLRGRVDAAPHRLDRGGRRPARRARPR